MNDPDKSDWTLFRSGDQEAFARIYARHRDHIFSFCLYTSGDVDVSKDVVQEAFLRLVQHSVCPDNVRNWLFIAARNCLYTQLKRSRRAGKNAGDGLSHRQHEMSAEQRLIVEQMLSKLSVEERELILLREFAGFTVAELAESLEISPEALRVRLYRIRKKLRTLTQGDI